MEKHGIIHRDLKPANILLNKDGVLKIIDFGMARHSNQQYFKEEFRQFTPNVTTALYRAPEVFFGEKLYSSKVDVWAAGCIYFELLTSQPLMPLDKGEIGIYKGMLQLFGIPDESSWPGVSNLPFYRSNLNYFKTKPI